MREEFNMAVKFNISQISKSDSNRWFAIMDGTGDVGLVLFGWAGEQNVSELITGQPTLSSFPTENELEAFVNNDTGIADYYKDAVENNSVKFQGPSNKYEPIIPDSDVG